MSFFTRGYDRDTFDGHAEYAADKFEPEPLTPEWQAVLVGSIAQVKALREGEQS